MALIPPFFLDCVVAIGFADAAVTVHYKATGFLYGRLVTPGATPTENRYRVYLITNRHVFENETKAHLRFNASATGPAQVFEMDLKDGSGKRNWVTHADPDIDLAVVGINAGFLEEKGIQFSVFRQDLHLLGRTAAQAAGLSEGDGVFILGFPLGQVGKERNYVLVRQGVIARVRDYLAGHAKDFLVDASIFPGNSGGPVVTRPEVTAITGTKTINAAHLIGVVQSYLPYQDVAISQQTRRPRIIFEENSGLAAVVPVDCIIEAVEQAEAALPKPAPAPSPTT
jgi:S1-C subfamily serine protease